jgi:hypothetical protein
LGEDPQSCVIFLTDEEIEWSCYIQQPQHMGAGLKSLYLLENSFLVWSPV